MALRTIGVALLLSSMLIAGCGTVTNLVKPGSDGGACPFGGMREDVCCLKKAQKGEICFGKTPKPESEQSPHVALMLLCAADLPFSLIGDVLTWPYTATYSYINQPIPTPPVMPVPPPPKQAGIPGPAGTQATTESRPPTYP